jgi:hypothetical protein
VGRKIVYKRTISQQWSCWWPEPMRDSWSSAGEGTPLCVTFTTFPLSWFPASLCSNSEEALPLFIYFFLLLCWIGVHCDIYKSSYNVSNMSYLNSSLHRSLVCSFPHSWNCFNRYHFSIYVHVCPVIALYSASHTLSQTLPSLTGTQSQAGSVSPSSSPIL